MSAQTLTEWCDDGLSTVLSHLSCLNSTNGQPFVLNENSQVQGFVGRVSGSLAAIERTRWHLLSIRISPLRNDPSICDVPLWRLTCEWGTHPHPSLQLKPGVRSG